MGFYRLSIFSNAFTHLVKVLKTDNIGEIYARREWIIEKGTKKIDSGLPFLFKREKLNKRIGIHKRNHITEPFPLKKTIKWLALEEVGDMAVLSFSLLVKSNILKEMFEKKISKKITDDKFLLRFYYNHEKELENLRSKVMEIMKNQIDNLGFKIATLDLNEIYYYEDYKREKNFPLLDDVQKDKKILKELADEFLNEFIIIGGIQKKIRAIKFYDYDRRNILTLKESEMI